MSNACFIPIKKHSRRVPGKNFRELGGKPLYCWLFDAVHEAACFDRVYVDTDAPAEVGAAATERGFSLHPRKPELAQDDANGNDLIKSWVRQYPDYDTYFQLFVTAPFLTAETIRACANYIGGTATRYDSVMTVTQERGWYWRQQVPVNFRPGILPRSQDAEMLIKETTGLYGITRAALLKYQCRTGANPMFYPVWNREAVDIDTDEDFRYAEYLIKETQQ